MSSNPSKGPLLDAEPARQHVRSLIAAGVSVQRLSDHTGVSTSVISVLIYSVSGRPPAAKIRTANANALLSVQAGDVVPGRIDATGTRRRIQALVAAGWPQLHIGPQIKRHPFYVSELLKQDRVYAYTAQDVAAAYNRIWNADPQRYGVPLSASKIARRLARSKSWAPPAAWDDDEIDHPAAQAEWTGYCGTDRGYWTHRNQKLPMCQPCEAAHQKWLTAQNASNRAELGKKQLLARAAASNRGAEIAEDARELMRQGYDAEQAAARLGIGKHYLQQELIRHPDPAVPAAA